MVHGIVVLISLKSSQPKLGSGYLHCGSVVSLGSASSLFHCTSSAPISLSSLLFLAYFGDLTSVAYGLY